MARRARSFPNRLQPLGDEIIFVPRYHSHVGRVESRPDPPPGPPRALQVEQRFVMQELEVQHEQRRQVEQHEREFYIADRLQCYCPNCNGSEFRLYNPPGYVAYACIRCAVSMAIPVMDGNQLRPSTSVCVWEIL